MAKFVMFGIPFILYMYVGFEIGFGGWISTYAILSNLMSEKEAPYGCSIFWGALTFGRLIGILLSTRLEALKFLTFDIVGTILTSIFIIFISDSKLVIYLGGFMLGFFLSTMFPLIISLPTGLKM